MGKVSGSYESVVRGVSEQVPHDRLSGQHDEQVNMVSDPVTGLARRHGSELLTEKELTTVTASFADMVSNTDRHKVDTFYVGEAEYDFIYRTTEDTEATGQDGFAWVFDKDANVYRDIVYTPGDALVDSLVSGGVSAFVNLGKFILLAGNTISPSWSTTDHWDAAANKQRLAVWVRGGAYSRNFSATLTKDDGTTVTADYKTVSASYPTLLDTSDLLTSDPDYQKKVNDRVYAYNSEVTAWIGTAAEDITPENIASELAADFIAQGVTGVSTHKGTVIIENASYVEVTAEDAGDNSLIHGVGNELPAADLLSSYHYVGKVVKIVPKQSNGDDAFYMEAYAKDDVATGWAEVGWRESKGVEITPDTVFVIGTVKDDTLYLGSDPAALEATVGYTIPPFVGSSVGDGVTTPLPEFFGNRIDYLGVFQDRLVIGTGPVLLFSRSGDYFNWFRKSVLTILDDDPIELFTLGSEDDTIKASTLYNRDIMFWGRRGQYSITGSQVLTPKNASIVTLASHEEGMDTSPVASGNFVFFAKKRGPVNNRVTSLHQVQPAQLVNNTESVDISQALDRYMRGTAMNITAMTSPNTVVVQTDGYRDGVYLYNYLDRSDNGQRALDSWHRWQWSPYVGTLVGCGSTKDNDLLMYLLKEGASGEVWLSCERFTLDSEVSVRPYLDSLRIYEETPSGYLADVPEDVRSVAYGEEAGDVAFLGTSRDRADTFSIQYDLTGAHEGIDFDGYVTPTNPYIRDQNGRAVVAGRLTLGQVFVSFADTGGAEIDVTSAGRTRKVTDFSGRRIGSPDNLIGSQPITSTSLSGFIGKEVRDCEYKVKTKRWLPMTITAIEWVGHYFNRVRRF